MTDRERLLDKLRPVAFAIAYRMPGSASESENVVQEALLRVHQALNAGEQTASPRTFAATVTTGWAINELRSAGALRERYAGEWLPEPIITDGHGDPACHAEMADSMSLAMLVPTAPAPVPAGRAALMSWEQATPATPALPRPPWHSGETVGRQLHRGSCRRCIGGGLRQYDAAPRVVAGASTARKSSKA